MEEQEALRKECEMIYSNIEDLSTHVQKKLELEIFRTYARECYVVVL